jgi:hypothetical protein
LTTIEPGCCQSKSGAGNTPQIKRQPQDGDKTDKIDEANAQKNKKRKKEKKKKGDAFIKLCYS